MSVQLAAPGVHTCGAHAPPVQLCVAVHATIVYPRPSGLQVRAVVIDAQSMAPGVHTRVWQIPPAQTWFVAHASGVQAEPFALQVRMWSVSGQSVTPGVQTRAWQFWSVPQYCVIVQSVSARHSTQCMAVVLQTRPMSLHWREETQGRGGLTQTLARQTCPPLQSTSVSQSTQYPSVVSQTWPGHVRDVVQLVIATQWLALQAWPGDVQSVDVTQSTQWPWLRSQTCPAVEHSRSDWQDTGPLSIPGTSGLVESTPAASALPASTGVAEVLGVLPQPIASHAKARKRHGNRRFRAGMGGRSHALPGSSTARSGDAMSCLRDAQPRSTCVAICALSNGG